MGGPETLQDNEKYPEAEKKIANVKKNLLAYFDTDYIRVLFEESKNDFGTMEKKEGTSIMQRNNLTTEEVEKITGEKNGIVDKHRTIKSFYCLGMWYYNYGKGYYSVPTLASLASSALSTKGPITWIDKQTYDATLIRADELEKKKTINDTKEFLKKIDDIIVIMPRSERDKSDRSVRLTSLGGFSPTDNKIYLPDDANELTLAHEMMHAIQFNFHWVNNLLTINKSQISTVSEELRNKFSLKSLSERDGFPDFMLEAKYKKQLFSDIELHAYIFELKYACKLYLTPPVELGSTITADDINQLMKNTKYLEAIKDSCSITEYLAFIDSEIVKEIIDTAITKETDITLREKLLDERVKILTELLELANEDLVMNDSTTKENLDFRV